MPRAPFRSAAHSALDHRPAFASIGSPAACHASHPPTSARARPHPAFCSSSAARALVASSGQAQKAINHVCR
ncbi:MAG: hypothetical protein ABWZ17_06005, partial [Candidatus Binatia bacterium]